MKLFKKRKRQAPRESKSQEQNKPAPMFSYHAQRSSAESSERAQSNQQGIESKPSSPKQNWWRHIPTLLAVAIIVSAVGYSLTLSTLPKVIILGDETTSNLLHGDGAAYQKLMQSDLKNSVFNRSKLTLDTNKLTRTLKEKYPEFSDLVVVIPLIGRRPIIQVRPTQVVFVLTNANGSYLIDKQGRAVIEAQPNSQPSITVPTVVDETGVDVDIGKSVLPKETLIFMDEVNGQFQAKNILIEKMTLPALANELHVKPAGQTYYIKFNMEGDARQQVGAYLALQEKLTVDKVIPGEYVDVRVEEKVFYR